MAGRTAADSNSRIGSRGYWGSLKRSESEILRDPEIWQISDSDEFDDENKSNKNSDEENQSKRDSENDPKDEN